MKSPFKRFLTLVFVLTVGSFFGQNFKTELKMIDSSNASISARMCVKEISKTGFDELAGKIKGQNKFTVSENDFFTGKNAGEFVIRSANKATLYDFQLFLKQLSIDLIVYKNQTISSEQLSEKYQHYKKDEIKKIDRIK